MAAEPVSWLGVTYDTPTRIASAHRAGKVVGHEALAYPGVTGVSFVPRAPRTAMGLEIHAPSLTETLVTTAQRLPGVPLYVTGNGGAFEDVVTEDGIHDRDRIEYYRDHIHAALDATEQGVELLGYFAWSLFDGLEWTQGSSKRCGMIRVDGDSPERTLKDSALFLREMFTQRS